MHACGVVYNLLDEAERSAIYGAYQLGNTSPRTISEVKQH